MGLGHLRRTRNIAEELIRQASGSEILVLADSPVAPFFVPVPRIRYRKLPTILKTGKAKWRTLGGPRNVGSALEKRSNMIRAALRGFRPHVVLIDHMPVGALGELRPMLDDVRGHDRPPKLVLGLRDILDNPATIRRAWSDVDAYEYLELYDKVLIYGCREIFDAVEAYGLTQKARDVAYTQYVVSNSVPSKSKRPLAEPYVLVMGGGGADAFPLASCFLDAWSGMQDTERRACILTGPNMDREQRARIRARADALNVHVPRRRVDAIPWIRQADAVVTMAGYNSLAEVLRWGRPALVVPRRGPSAEQRMRAERFDSRGITTTLDPDDATGEALARKLTGLLNGAGIPDAANIPAMDGAASAAQAILSAVHAPAAPRSAHEEAASSRQGSVARTAR